MPCPYGARRVTPSCVIKSAAPVIATPLRKNEVWIACAWASGAVTIATPCTVIGDGNEKQDEQPAAQAGISVDDDQGRADQFDHGGEDHPEAPERNRGRHQRDVPLETGEVRDARQEEDEREQHPPGHGDCRMQHGEVGSLIRVHAILPAPRAPCVFASKLRGRPQMAPIPNR